MSHRGKLTPRYERSIHDEIHSRTVDWRHGCARSGVRGVCVRAALAGVVDDVPAGPHD